jgi:Mn-dependent DtxR family transcriptional regulator
MRSKEERIKLLKRASGGEYVFGVDRVPYYNKKILAKLMKCSPAKLKQVLKELEKEGLILVTPGIIYLYSEGIFL